MKAWPSRWVLGLAAGVLSAGCSRADLYAITSESATDVGGAAGAAASCPPSPLAAGDTTVTLPVGSASRSFVLHVPASYDGKQPVPLVVDFMHRQLRLEATAGLRLCAADRCRRRDHCLSRRSARAARHRLELWAVLRGGRG